MQRLLIVIVITLVAQLALPVFVFQANATQIADRSFYLTSNAPAALTTHRVYFNLLSASNVGSIVIEYCNEDPFVGFPCTAPSNMNATGAVLATQTGETGFSIDVSTTANRIVLTRAASVVTPGNVSYIFNNVLNPDTTGSYYVRLSTHASSDGTGPFFDQGGVAIAIEDQFTIGGYVPPFLLFCVGVTVVNNCNTTGGSLVSLGVLSPTATASGTSQMSGATNAEGGFNVALTGTTMTSGNNVIPALTSPSSPIVGVSQFGLNLRANTIPAAGSNPTNPTGEGTAAPRTNYNQQNRFMFQDGDTLYGTTTTTNYQTFTATYMVNISEDQKVGVYATTLSFVAFATF